MDKYYTPEINEFHVGFEFEFNGIDCNWIRGGFEKNKILKNDKEYFGLFTLGWVQKIYEGPVDEWIRVKYLDKEDIDSLIVYDKEIIEFIDENVYEFKYSKSGTEYSVFYTYSDKMISFYEISPDDKLNCIFRGTIKSKSELQKLLKQLEII